MTPIPILPPAKRGTSRLVVSVRRCDPGRMSALRAESDLLPERDSPRDQLVVTLFLLTVFGLLLGAGIKGRMLKAGLDTTLPWATSRRWWEVRVSPPVPRVMHVSRPVWFLGMGSSTAAGGYPAQRCGPLAKRCSQGPSGRLYQRLRLTAERVMCSVEDYAQGRTGRYRYSCIIFCATLAARCSNYGSREMAPYALSFRRSVLVKHMLRDVELTSLVPRLASLK